MSHADNRVGPEESGTVIIAAGDGQTPQTALDIPSDALFSLDRIVVEAEAGDDDGIEVYDEADGTSYADASDLRDVVTDMDTDQVQEREGPYRDFEEGVLVASRDDNITSDVHVTVHGHLLTDLADVAGH